MGRRHGVVGSGLFCMMALGGCSSGSGGDASGGRGGSATNDRPLLAPEHCVFSPSAERLCEPSAELGAGGQGGAPLGDCLVASDATLSCPSLLSQIGFARGADAFDVLVTQKGRDGIVDGVYTTNTHEYVEGHRLDDEGATQVRFDVFEPEPAEDLASRVLRLLPGAASEESVIVRHQRGSATEHEIFFEGLFGTTPPGSVSSSLAPRHDGSVARLPRHEIVLTQPPELGVMNLVVDLLDAPQSFSFPTTYALAVAEDSQGELRVLRQDREAVELLGGDQLDQPLGTWRTGDASGSILDLVYFEQDGAEQSAALFVKGTRSGLFSPGWGSDAVSQSFTSAQNTCPGFYVGFTCDDCPVGDRCGSSSESVTAAKLFVQDERLFLAYVGTQIVGESEIVKDTNIIIGCSCQPNQISKGPVEDILVVKEVRRGAEDSFQLVPVMRAVVGEPNSVGLVQFQRGASGLAVLLGSSLGRATDGLADFPAAPVKYRILQLGGGGE